MPLDEDAFAPNTQTVLFHLTLFLEFCEAYEAEELSASIPCECLRDAVEDLCLSLATPALISHEPAALVTALQQSEAAFRDAMPDLHRRTGAARGVAALIALVTSAEASEPCSDRESRSTALGVARRFGKTLGAFAGFPEPGTIHHGQEIVSQRLVQDR